MNIIKLNAIDSTNTYLKAMIGVLLPKDYTVIVAESQTNGRGQMGETWKTEPGKNLTASVFKDFKKCNVNEQFYISMVVSLSICKALNVFKIPKLQIKWPNDIMSVNKKICGILIENVVKNAQIKGSVLGFGLNINQIFFKNLPKATSMALILDKNVDKDLVLVEIVKQLKAHFKILESGEFSKIKVEYESLLFRKNKPSTFKSKDNTTFSGIINGVTETGKLKVYVENTILKIFDLKDVTLLY